MTKFSVSDRGGEDFWEIGNEIVRFSFPAPFDVEEEELMSMIRDMVTCLGNCSYCEINFGPVAFCVDGDTMEICQWLGEPGSSTSVKMSLQGDEAKEILEAMLDEAEHMH